MIDLTKCDCKDCEHFDEMPNVLDEWESLERILPIRCIVCRHLKRNEDHYVKRDE